MKRRRDPDVPDQLEAIIDKQGLSNTIFQMATICYFKADYLEHGPMYSSQRAVAGHGMSARKWREAGDILQRAVTELRSRRLG